MFDPSQDLTLNGSGNRFTDFQNLMRDRINEILLVSSLYDSFILAQDGQLQELILSEFMELNLYHSPGLTRVASARDALSLVTSDPRFNLIITTANVGDMHVSDFARQAKAAGVRAPIILLTYDSRDIDHILRNSDMGMFDRVFIWQGDFRILLGIVKYVEDRLNVDHDTQVMGVQTLLLVEDNIRFYSSYLPMIYTELMRQSQNLLEEGINMAHKILRMRARPKILLCTNFEEAWEMYRRYEKHMIGVITDIEYSHEGKKDPEAGAELVRRIRARRDDLPILLQSFRQQTAKIARSLGVDFLRKDSPTLLHDLRTYMTNNYGFGDFIFRTSPNGPEIDRARDLKSLEEKLHTVPARSIVYHAERDHFSNWLKARTEFGLADILKPRKVSDFPTPEDLRKNLIDSLSEFRRERSRGTVSDFRYENFDPSSSFARLGGGSMGGKARGLAFLAHMIDHFGLRDRFPGVQISTPASAVICTDIFDEFLEDNDLLDFALREGKEKKLRKRFLAATFPMHAQLKLAELLELMPFPLAVRSSGLLEDSHYQPFAGIYATYMLPNNHPDPNVRLEELIRAIKLVYASTYGPTARAYIKSTPYRMEEEKMAVIVQQLVGTQHENRFYPDFSGVARSHNFYPTLPATSEDGIVNVAMGLGTYVVEGGEGVRFCPKYPRHIAQFATLDDFLNYSQKIFYALDLPDQEEESTRELDLKPASFDLTVARKDGTLNAVASVYSEANQAVYDGLGRDGMPLVSFAPILKHKLFPLPEIVRTFLELGERGINRPVEVEFAVNLAVEDSARREFVMLQIRPLVLNRELEELKIEEVESEKMLCQSKKVLGIGRIDDIYDVIAVDISRFKRSASAEVAREVGRFNAQLVRENRPYLLIGVGRWGSTDPWLGIPVTWEQINGARVIVESGFDDFKVEPSEGAHFFHNITSLMIGYFTVNPQVGQGCLDWEWLKEQPTVQIGKYVRHIRFDEPIVVKMNGHMNRGIILKPGVEPAQVLVRSGNSS